MTNPLNLESSLARNTVYRQFFRYPPYRRSTAIGTLFDAFWAEWDYCQTVQIALTFDTEHPDRPHAPPGVAERIIATLRTTGVPATFFLQGRWVEAYPHIAREIVRDGHRIGNHSFYHARLTQLTDEGLTADVVEAERVIKAVTGADPKPWFRSPWGECGDDDSRIVRMLANLGYRHVGWHVEAKEWEIARTPNEIEDTVVAGALAAGERAIILLHTWPASVPAVLPAMIRRLREAGAEFATLDDLHPSAFGGYLLPAVGRLMQGRVV